MSGKRLMRSRKESMIAGVCGGLANYFSLDPVLIRIVLVLFTLGGGSGIFLYLLLLILMPLEPQS
ncbi:MAG: PspC domain-containing protein [Anaerolineales bacterium]|nr:PspC domain-containing protein [Anaerolineales bacterium]